jgi:hypothetical protein
MQNAKPGFTTCVPSGRRLSCTRGTRTLIELADEYAHTYAPFIQAAVREVGHNYRQVANWLTGERIRTQRNGQWKSPEREKSRGRVGASLTRTRGSRRQRTALDGLERRP